MLWASCMAQLSAIHLLRTRSRESTGARRPSAVLTHVPAIDALRGLAILIVMFHHFTPAISGGAMTRRFLEVAHTGWLGVDLFFVLSGFLITSILLRTRNNEDYFRNFYGRRTLRIFPIYYLTLTLLFVGIPLAMRLPILSQVVAEVFGPIVKQLPGLIRDQGWLWLYGTNFKIAAEGERWGAVNHFWSLAVEEHFYMVWPLVVWLASRQTLLRICVALMIAAPMMRAGVMLAGLDPVIAYVLTPCRLDSLACGGLVAALILEPNGPRVWARRLSWVCVPAILAIVAICLKYHRFDRRDLMTTVLGYSAVSLISVTIILQLSRLNKSTRLHRVIANPVLQSFGKYSYGIYLLHPFFIPLSIAILPWTTLATLTGSYLAAILIHAIGAIGIAWCVGWMSYHAFEKHFLKLKFLFDYRTAAPAQTPSLRLPQHSAAPASSRRAA